MRTGKDRGGRRAAPRAVAFWLVATAFAVTMLGTTLPTPLYVLYERSLGFGTLMVTVIFAAYAVGVLLALLFFGRLSDEIGRRRALLPGLLCAALSALAFLAADGLPLLFAGRVLSGLSAGIFTGTATAALVDLAGPRASGRASLVATVVNMGGLGSGPLLAGFLAEYAPWPLRLPYAVHLGLLAVAFAGVWAMPDPVGSTGRPRWRVRVLRPHVPDRVRGTFVRASLAGFAGFAVLGLFTAVAPSFLGRVLGVHDLALAGAVVFLLFTTSTIGQAALVPMLGSRSLPVGCCTLIVGMGVLAAAFATESLAMLLVAAVISGLGQGAGFRAGLAAVNAQTPAEERGTVASTFFLVLYVALSLPVVGVGVAAQLLSLRTAGIAFACAVAAVTATALVLLVRADRTESATALVELPPHVEGPPGVGRPPHAD